MRRFLGMVVASLLLLVSLGAARADDQDAKSILDKAIKALGGEEKLAKVQAFAWKAKGTVSFNGNDNEFTSETTIKGFDHLKREFGNDQFHGVLVVAGDKGWRHFGDNQAELEGDGLAGEKRNIYLQVIPITLVAIKGKGFKYEAAGEEKVGDKPAVILKITGPDGKDFKLFFDKESGLPVKEVATVRGFQGDDVEQEATYSDYKDYGGIKKATKGQVKRNGEVFQVFELTEFKVLDKVDPETFTEPK
jgi:hypothetical protein